MQKQDIIILYSSKYWVNVAKCVASSATTKRMLFGFTKAWQTCLKSSQKHLLTETLQKLQQPEINIYNSLWLGCVLVQIEQMFPQQLFYREPPWMTASLTAVWYCLILSISQSYINKVVRIFGTFSIASYTPKIFRTDAFLTKAYMN